jgi:hypothetical protein
MRDQLRISWVTLDRFCQEEAAKDEPLRRKLEADNRPLRSSAAKLTSGELLDKLRSTGFELDRSGVGNLCTGALSGRAVRRGGGTPACAATWLDAWADVLRWCDATGIGSIDEFDDRFPLTGSGDMNHRPFGRKIRKTRYEYYTILSSHTNQFTNMISGSLG